MCVKKKKNALNKHAQFKNLKIYFRKHVYYRIFQFEL